MASRHRLAVRTNPKGRGRLYTRYRLTDFGGRGRIPPFTVTGNGTARKETVSGKELARNNLPHARLPKTPHLATWPRPDPGHLLRLRVNPTHRLPRAHQPTPSLSCRRPHKPGRGLRPHIAPGVCPVRSGGAGVDRGDRVPPAVVPRPRGHRSQARNSTHHRLPPSLVAIIRN